VISASAMTVFAALLTSAPAKADLNYGPLQNGSQCWTYTPNSKEFGYWSTCPRPASVAAPAHHKSRHH
jgi:D-alanyl-D-alanine dipeptidase